MQERLVSRLAPPEMNLWGCVKSVLHRGFTTGAAFDVPEAGVAVFAVRVHENESADDQLRAAIDRLNRTFPLDRTGTAVSTGDLAEHPRLSVLVPPVPVWPIPGDQRNAVLAGRLFLGVRMAQDLWEKAFEAQGIGFEDAGDEWHVELDGKVGRIDRLETWKLQLGVALSGVSPEAIAKSLREALEATEAT
jgi:hypothetical protein